MEALFELTDNNIPEILNEKLMISCIIILLSLLMGYMMINSLKDEESQSLENEYLNLESIRNYIESFSDNSDEYKILQSILLPKKGDYVELNQGRWENYVGRITSIVNTEHGNKYNIKVHIRDNINYGSDIPHYLLKSKNRDFFRVLTDQEIESYDLLDDNEYFDRYYTTIYS
jgi:hypothetical protein